MQLNKTKHKKVMTSLRKLARKEFLELCPELDSKKNNIMATVDDYSIASLDDYGLRVGATILIRWTGEKGTEDYWNERGRTRRDIAIDLYP